MSGRALRPWFRPIFAMGHATKGIVYLLVGGLALLTVFGSGGKVAGEEGAVRSIGEQPFGRVLLLATAVGLTCYALWQLVLAIANLEEKDGAVGLGKRAAQLVSAAMHGLLALTAFQLGLGERAHRHEGKARIWAAEVLDKPFGDVLVAAFGVGLVAFAVYEIRCAVLGRLPDQFKEGVEPLARTAGRLGLAARGVVFAIIGARLVAAGFDRNPHHARDFGSALRELAAQSGGAALLAAVATGLAAYGIYQLVVTKHGRVPGS